MRLPHHSIILVADAARMLLLRNEGSAIHADLRVLEHRHCESVPNREIASDAPGVVFESANPASSTYDERDPRTDHEILFLRSAAEALETRAKAATGAIVVAAAPAALGRLRQLYGRATREKLLAEIDHDYTRMPVEVIASTLLAR